MTKTNTCKSI